MSSGKFRKMLYCPKCFSRKHIENKTFGYFNLFNGTKTMNLTFRCSYCKQDFSLKLEGEITK